VVPYKFTPSFLKVNYSDAELLMFAGMTDCPMACQNADPDLWIIDCDTPYECVLVYVLNLICKGSYAQAYYDTLICKELELHPIIYLATALVTMISCLDQRPMMLPL
jgi:hypothetical protein